MLARRIAWLFALLLVPQAVGAEDRPLKAQAYSTQQHEEEQIRRVTKLIDNHLTADWAAKNIRPAAIADDEEFLRRASLDLIGRIPKVAEVHAFVDDSDAGKRAKVVAKLLKSPLHASHHANITRLAWMPETQADIQLAYAGTQYQEWLRRKISENTPLDQIVRATLTAEVYFGQRGFRRPNQPLDQLTQGLYGFYQAAMAKPENLGALVSRAFLGIKLECAQCHDHPFAPYTRTQFWEFAAFFAEFTPLPPLPPNFVGPIQPQTDKNVLQIPGTNRSVSAKFMDGSEPKWTKDRSPRLELADWITSAKNPYFAKNLVNRLWAQYFGIGLIDPVDEPGENNPASHPELLTELARALIEAKYDQRIVIQGIMASRAYNLTSRLSHPSQSDPRTFARMNLKGLTGGQIYDSYVAATGVRVNTSRNLQYYDPYSQSGRSLFDLMFPASQRPTETQTSILQALMMMNGKPVAEQTSLDRSEILAAVIDAPFLDTGKKIDTLFISALTRKPTPEEREKLTSYVDRGGPSGDAKKALADIFWVLLNSTEFMFNH